MAELAGHAVLAALDPAVLQYGAADSGTERDHHEVVLAASGAEAPLRPGGGVRVVVDHHRDGEPGGDRVPERFVAPGEVRGEEDLRAVGVHPAGGADAHGVHVVPVGEVEHQLDNGVLDDLRALGLVRRLGADLLQDVAVRVHDTGHHLRTADVDPHRGHAGRGGVRAALAGADGPQDGGACGAAVGEVPVRTHRTGPLTRAWRTTLLPERGLGARTCRVVPAGRGLAAPGARGGGGGRLPTTADSAIRTAHRSVRAWRCRPASRPSRPGRPDARRRPPHGHRGGPARARSPARGSAPPAPTRPPSGASARPG